MFVFCPFFGANEKAAINAIMIYDVVVVADIKESESNRRTGNSIGLLYLSLSFSKYYTGIARNTMYFCSSGDRHGA